MTSPLFGSGATLGPIGGSAGPQTVRATSGFSPVFGEVQFGGGSGALQTVTPWVVVGVLGVSGIIVTWLVLR